MKFRGKVTAALAVVIAVSLFALVSCGAKNDAEILSALSEKYPKALYLAEVIYDDVLPHEAEPSSGKYYAVSDDSEIQSINDLKNALGEVYTQSYIKVLENTALNGATSDDVSISAKFIEKDGKLYVNPESTEHFGDDGEMTQVLRDQGAASLMGIDTAVGGEAFIRALQIYADENAGGTGSLEKLESALEQATGSA